jgi:hypothetical protein
VIIMTDLNYLDGPIANAPEADGGGAGPQLPDGTYQAVVKAARIVDKQTMTWPALVLTFVELSETMREIDLFQSLSSEEKRLPYLKRLIVQLWPAPTPKPSEIIARLDELIDRTFEIKVVSKRSADGSKEYRNVYIQRHLEGVEVPF